jgi:hypothetical protein
LIGIENDLQLLGASKELILDRRGSYSRAKAKPPSVSIKQHRPGTAAAGGGGVKDGDNVIADSTDSHDSNCDYHSMSAHTVGHFT